MLYGTGGIDPVAECVSRMGSNDREGLTLAGLDLLRETFEIARRDVATLFQPVLHATLPPLVRASVCRCKQETPDPSRPAEAQPSSRSGARSRIYLLDGLIDSEEADGLKFFEVLSSKDDNARSEVVRTSERNP